MRMIIQEIKKIFAQDIPLTGVCVYPIIDRFDWENDNHWHNSGLWDYSPGKERHHLRVLTQDYAAEIQRAVQLFSSSGTNEITTTTPSL